MVFIFSAFAQYIVIFFPRVCLHQWFTKCAPRIHNQFPTDPWIHFFNGYFEVYLFFKLKIKYFVKNNRESLCNGPTNALVCNKTLIQMSHIKTFKITPTRFDHQMIIIRELFDPG
jgi:hypothetical protein